MLNPYGETGGGYTTVSEKKKQGGLPWEKIIGGGLTGIGLLGGFGGADIPDIPDLPEIPITAEDIDEAISQLRAGGYKRIGGELSRQNVAAASQLASRGMGKSTMVTGALAANRQQMLESLGGLEATLSEQQMQGMQNLYQMQMQRAMAQWQMESQRAQMESQGRGDIFRSIADIGGMLLAGPTGGASVPVSQGLKQLF